MFKKYAKMLMIGFIIGMAALMPNVECLPVFEKDEITQVKKNNDNDDEGELMNFEFPPLQGCFGVGKTTRYIIDCNRQESHNPSARRELMLYVWYPASADKDSLEPYRKDEIESTKDALRSMGYSEKDLGYLDIIYTHAVPNAALLKQEAPFPVVLFSHGYLGTKPVEYTAFCEELASHGYIVVAIAHTYYASSVTFPDGRHITTPPEKYTQKPNFNEEQAIWVSDVQFVLDQLSTINADHADQFFHCFDLRRIGMFGHSFGGLTALRMCLQDDRIKAGMNLDQMPYDDSDMTCAKPFMFLMAQKTVDGINAFGSSDEELAKVFECDVALIKQQKQENLKDWEQIAKNYKKLMQSKTMSYTIIPNSMHGAFSDHLLLKELPLYKNNRHIINLGAVVGAADGFATMKSINEYIVCFFDKFL